MGEGAGRRKPAEGSGPEKDALLDGLEAEDGKPGGGPAWAGARRSGRPCRPEDASPSLKPG
ncbi:MAG: hypothetical protein HYZ11_01325 [Candidatus Tectomicrobia bacterium]|uniref:Uncharacterized protein n=1 Tax=Tectimicrobiota bacterium TaxID=2528274 RepID=A0A932HXM5_UNCTE|nr:hypothetical protein [Candidatus Tectomicrobia bacterium]